MTLSSPEGMSCLLCSRRALRSANARRSVVLLSFSSAQAVCDTCVRRSGQWRDQPVKASNRWRSTLGLLTKGSSISRDTCSQNPRLRVETGRRAMSVMAWKRYDRITSYSRHSGQRRFLVLKAASCRSACVLLAAPTDGNRCIAVRQASSVYARSGSKAAHR